MPPRRQGLAQQRPLLLPVPSFLVTCPCPEALRPLARSPQPLLDTLLLHTSAAAWQPLALAPRSRGGPSGMGGVLPPWPRELASHPPVHALLPGGALSPADSQGRSPRCAAWRVPVCTRSRLFRGTDTAALTTAGLCEGVPPPVWHQAWVTHGQPAGTGTAGLASCAPSISRLALTQNRLATLADGPGTFRCKQRSGAGWTRLPRPAAACLHRCRQPVRPRGCSPVRSYGLLRPSRRTGLPQIRTLLAASPRHAPAVERVPRRDGHQSWPAPAQARRCRLCGGPLRVLVRLAPSPRAPPECPRAGPLIQGWHPGRLGRSTRRARLCRHRLRGRRWPAPATSVAACRPPRPARPLALRQAGSQAGLRPLLPPVLCRPAASLRLSRFSDPWPSQRARRPPPACSPQDGVTAPRHTNPSFVRHGFSYFQHSTKIVLCRACALTCMVDSVY
jgi:hypothetical protein